MPDDTATPLPCPRCQVDLHDGGIVQMLTSHNTYRFAVDARGAWRRVDRPADTTIAEAYLCGTCGAFIAAPGSIGYAQLREIVRSAR